MTKDLAISCGKKDDYVTTTEYMAAVEKRMKSEFERRSRKL